MSAFRQTCEAGVRYGYMNRNPAKLAGPNQQTAPRGVRVYTPKELDKIARELDAPGADAIRFAAATGLRPSEQAHVERRDVDRGRRVLSVWGTKRAISKRMRKDPLRSPSVQVKTFRIAPLNSPCPNSPSPSG